MVIIKVKPKTLQRKVLDLVLNDVGGLRKGSNFSKLSGEIGAISPEKRHLLCRYFFAIAVLSSNNRHKRCRLTAI